MRDDIEMSEAYVLIYDADGHHAYALYNTRASEENNALDSYKIHGGENDPFEYIKLEIPRKKMSQVASDLMKPGAITAGQNKIVVKAIGRGTYIVSASNLTGNTCTITGYCTAYGLTSTNSTADISGTPYEIIKSILVDNKYGYFMSGKLRYWFVDRNGPSDILSFPKGYSLWYILQVCSMYLGCKIFFTGDDAYLVDYRLPRTSSLANLKEQIPNLKYTTEDTYDKTGKVSGTEPDAVYDFDDIQVYTTDTKRPEFGKIVGQVKLGNEGQTTVINKVQITCINPDKTSETVVATAMSTKAMTMYNETEKAKYETTIDTLLQSKPDSSASKKYKQGSTIASNIIDYRCEAQQSVEFSMKELQSTNGKTHWLPFFLPSSRIRALDDDTDDIHVDNTSNINPSIIRPQKLILSSYTRNFPQGTSTYKFGVIASVDLSQKICDLSAATR